jgi:GTP-binding protein
VSRALPKIAIVGRQNVGKSTLANRLFGGRATIAHDQPGVTRDRIELEASWRGRHFGLVDTAGFRHDPKGLEILTGKQAALAAEEADLVLLVMDVQAGITEEDAELARRLRKSRVPVVVVANKADSEADLADVPELFALGAGEPVPVSALHGRGAGELLDRIVALLPDVPRADREGESEEPRFAIVGRPNVGKSSLFNRLTGEERAVVSEEPGTTRDAVDSVVDWPGYGLVRFVDTAGMRRGAKVRGVEYYSFLRATAAIDRAHVALLVLDAIDGFTVEDKKIASRVIDAGRALLVVANRWDLVEERDRTFKDLNEISRPFARTQVVRTSATDGIGVSRLPPLLLDLHRRWDLRVPTSRVNEVLHAAQAERPSPRSAGTLHYATQVSSGPPAFVVFGGARPPGPGYRRYLENRLRAEFGWNGVPLRLRFRSRAR